MNCEEPRQYTTILPRPKKKWLSIVRYRISGVLLEPRLDLRIYTHLVFRGRTGQAIFLSFLTFKLLSMMEGLNKTISVMIHFQFSNFNLVSMIILWASCKSFYLWSCRIWWSWYVRFWRYVIRLYKQYFLRKSCEYYYD